jgi:hypothetical protein
MSSSTSICRLKIQNSTQRRTLQAAAAARILLRTNRPTLKCLQVSAARKKKGTKAARVSRRTKLWVREASTCTADRTHDQNIKKLKPD